MTCTALHALLWAVLMPRSLSCLAKARSQAQAPAVLDDPGAVPQGNGHAGPALAGEVESAEPQVAVALAA